MFPFRDWSLITGRGGGGYKTGGGGHVKFHPYEKGGRNFVAPPPLPVINDQSLTEIRSCMLHTALGLIKARQHLVATDSQYSRLSIIYFLPSWIQISNLYGWIANSNMYLSYNI